MSKKQYKLIGEDDHTFKLQHPDGSQFSIAKSAVGTEVHKRIKALKMADGGEVPDESAVDVSDSPDTPNADTAKDINALPTMNVNDVQAPQISNANDIGAIPGSQVSVPTAGVPNPEVVSPDEAQVSNDQTPIAAQPTQDANASRTPASQSAPDYLDATQNPLNAAMAQMQAGSKQMTNAAVQGGKDIASAYDKTQQQADAINKQYQTELAQNEAEHKQLFDAVMNGKVDPHRLLSNMSTGNKIVAAIGIALSGIGSGLTGKPNMAMQVIQNEIDRDIKAQEMDLGKKNNLLSDNLRRYGNVQDAKRATLAQLYTATQAKIVGIQARTGAAQTAGQAQMMQAQFGLQAAKLNQDLALKRAEAKSMGFGGSEGGIPVGQEPFQMLSDSKYRQNRVVIAPGNGKPARAYQFTGTPQDAQNYRNVESVAGGVTDLVKQLDALGPAAMVPGSEAYNKSQALRYQLSTEIPKLKSMQIGAKRVNETEAERAEKMISDPTSFAQAVNGGIRNQVFFKTLEDELERSRKQNLIGYRGVDSYKTFKPAGQ